MKSHLRRLLAELGASDVLTHTLPYGTRIAARASARHS